MQSGGSSVSTPLNNPAVFVLVSVVGLFVFTTIIAMCFRANMEALDQYTEK